MDRSLKRLCGNRGAHPVFAPRKVEYCPQDDVEQC